MLVRVVEDWPVYWADLEVALRPEATQQAPPPPLQLLIHLLRPIVQLLAHQAHLDPRAQAVTWQACQVWARELRLVQLSHSVMIPPLPLTHLPKAQEPVEREVQSLLGPWPRVILMVALVVSSVRLQRRTCSCLGDKKVIGDKKVMGDGLRVVKDCLEMVTFVLWCFGL